MAQRIRSLKSTKHFSSESEREEWAVRTAQEQFAKENDDARQQSADSSDPIGESARAILNDLMGMLSGSDFGNASDELLRQCTVLAWGALEVLSTDLFVTVLNDRPSKTSDLLDHPIAKRYFEPKAFGAALESHNYDLSCCMGDVLIQQHRVDSVEAMRNIFSALYPADQRLQDQLQDQTLWMLAQDRNLIVHRRAVIDQQYLANTGSKLTVGSVLKIDPDLFERYLSHVRDVGLELLRSARDDLLR